MVRNETLSKWKNNIHWTENIDEILNTISSDFMYDYVKFHENSKFTLIYKHLTHSDLISSWKRTEKQGLEKNILNYLSVSQMQELKNNWEEFETAHQSCITIPKSIFENKLWIQISRSNQYYIDKLASVYLVTDSLMYFTMSYTKAILNKLWKTPSRIFKDEDREWKDLFPIKLTYAAHWLWTARDEVFHRLRQTFFRNDIFLLLIEITQEWKKNIYIMMEKNPIFYTILWLKNEKRLKLEEIRMNKIEKTLTHSNTLYEDLREEIDRSKQWKRRDILAQEMMNYTTHENEIFCPLTRISVNYNDVWTLFRASHIKPYKECNDYEKFDPNNWILIVANADALFDKFLITIEDDWTLIYSKYIENDKRLLEELLLTQPLFKGILNDQRRKYLEYHREVFKQKEHERFSA